MNKYVVSGLLLLMGLFLFLGITVNNDSNRAVADSINPTMKTVSLGALRDNGEDIAKGEADWSDKNKQPYGLRAKDVVAMIEKEMSDTQGNTDRVLVMEYTFFDKNDAEITIRDVNTDNRLVHGVQYRATYYRIGDVDSNGKIKENAKPQSQTIQKINLNEKTSK